MCNSIYADKVGKVESSLYLHIGEEGEDMCKYQLLSIINADEDIQRVVFSCENNKLNDVAYLSKSIKMMKPDIDTEIIIEDGCIDIDHNAPQRLVWFDSIKLKKGLNVFEMAVKKGNSNLCTLIIKA